MEKTKKSVNNTKNVKTVKSVNSNKKVVATSKPLVVKAQPTRVLTAEGWKRRKMKEIQGEK